MSGDELENLYNSARDPTALERITAVCTMHALALSSLHLVPCSVYSHCIQ